MDINIKRLLPALKLLGLDFDKMAQLPLEKQTIITHMFEQVMTAWIRNKKAQTILKENESELMLMFREQDNELLMIPVIRNEEDHIVRGLESEGINVTEMCKRIPTMKFLPLLMPAFKKRKSGEVDHNTMDIKMLQLVIAVLRTAASHPDCRLMTEEDLPEPQPQQDPADPALSADVDPLEKTEPPLPTGSPTGRPENTDMETIPSNFPLAQIIDDFAFDAEQEAGVEGEPPSNYHPTAAQVAQSADDAAFDAEMEAEVAAQMAKDRSDLGMEPPAADPEVETHGDPTEQ